MTYVYGKQFTCINRCPVHSCSPDVSPMWNKYIDVNTVVDKHNTPIYSPRIIVVLLGGSKSGKYKPSICKSLDLDIGWVLLKAMPKSHFGGRRIGCHWCPFTNIAWCGF